MSQKILIFARKFYRMINSRMRVPYIILTLLALLPLKAMSDNHQAAACPEVKMSPERLTPMNEPRAGHTTLYANGELTVIGGRTSGFVPVQTAEYFSNGSWHTMQMVYTHDNGTVVGLRSGQVLVFGGHSEALGIGHTFTVERYDPATHTFEGFGCLDTKRSLASAIELDSGRVAISGNHYYRDDIELYDSQPAFRHIKTPTVQRRHPYMLRSAADDALIFAPLDTCYHPIDASVVDRVKGSTFHAPLLTQWTPLNIESLYDSNCAFVGDEKKGVYANLIAAQDSCGQMAIILVRDTVFTLLPTDVPVPTRSSLGDITYYSPIVADRQTGKAYLKGCDNERRHYVLCIDYAAAVASAEHDSPTSVPAKLTLYYTDPNPDIGNQIPVLTPDGNLLIAGGIYDSNYKPFDTVWLFRFNPETAPASAGLLSATWVWLVLAVALLIIACAVFLVRRRQRATIAIETSSELDDATEDDPSDADDDSEPAVYNETAALLFEQLETLMTSQRLYLNSELKLSDVSEILKASKRSISDSVKATKGCSFSQFLNNLRIEHAKQMLRDNPNIKSTVLSTASGFANETSFFRNFKSVTGMTPREWLAQP
jgi:AraC-like DNA-binding protein